MCSGQAATANFALNRARVRFQAIGEYARVSEPKQLAGFFPNPSTLNSQPPTLTPTPLIQNPQLETLNPEPQILNPKPSTRNQVLPERDQEAAGGGRGGRRGRRRYG